MNNSTLITMGLTEDILTNIQIEKDEATQSSIIGTVKLTKKKLLVLRAKVWNNEPYRDFRVYIQKDDGLYIPTKQGFMIRESYKEYNKKEEYPFSKLIEVLDALRIFPSEKEATEREKEFDYLNKKMTEAVKQRAVNTVEA